MKTVILILVAWMGIAALFTGYLVIWSATWRRRRLNALRRLRSRRGSVSSGPVGNKDGACPSKRSDTSETP